MNTSASPRRQARKPANPLLARLLLFMLLLPSIALAEELELDTLRKEVRELRTVVDAVREDTRFLRGIFEQVQAQKNPVGPARVQLDESANDDPTVGAIEAPITVYGFLDYGCQFCAKFHGSTFPQIKKNYLQTGKVRFVFRDFFLDEGSPSIPAATFVSCAAEQGLFEEALQAFFGAAELLKAGELLKIIERVSGIDRPKFDSCIHSEKLRIPVSDRDEPLPSQEAFGDLSEAATMQITGAPTFFIFLTKDFNTTVPVTGFLVRGEQSFETFQGIFDTLLAGPPALAKKTQ